MLIIDGRVLFFDCKEIWFSPEPYDIDDVLSLRFRACDREVGIDGFSKVAILTPVIDLRRGIDTIWDNIDRSVRKDIKKAEKEGVTIKVNDWQEEFTKMVSALYLDKGLRDPCLTTDQISRTGILFTAEKDGELLAGQYDLFDESHMRGLYGASSRLRAEKEKANLIGCAYKLVQWTAIKHAEEKGIIEYDMGGYAKKEEVERAGINSFKDRFGGTIVTKYDYQKYGLRMVRLADSIGLVRLTNDFRRKATRKYPSLHLYSGRSL